MSGPPTLNQLLEESRFLEALNVIGREPFQPLECAIRAELLLQTGDVSRAIALAKRTLKNHGAQAAIAARCLMVLGAGSAQKGDLKAARERLQRSIALSDEAKDYEQGCWSSLRLLSIVADGDLDNAIALVPTIRKRLARIGSAQATCALHASIAEIEAKRSFVHSAVHHLRVAQSILERCQNYWLEGRLHNSSCMLALITFDVPAAIRRAREAWRSTAVSGHALGTLAAMTNLAHSHLLLGDFERAQKWLRNALRGCVRGGGAEAAILDGLAQIHLVVGDNERCERTLARTDVSEEQLQDTNYYQTWTIPTRVRLLLTQGQAETGLRLAAFGRVIAEKRTDHPLAQLLRLLQSEALLLAGRTADAEALVCAAAKEKGETPLETLPRVARMFAKLFEAQGNRAAALERFGRAARMLAGADECSRAEVLDDYIRLLWPDMERKRPGRLMALAGLPCLRVPASRVTMHPAEATEIGPPETQVSPVSALERATIFIDLAGRPLCIGQELQDTLRRCGAIRDAAMVARPSDRAPELLAFWGDYKNAGALVAAGDGVERIALGRWREAEVDLLLTVAPDLEARAAVIAARKLVDAGLALDAARREQRERAALWPLDEPIEARHGVFASQVMTELVATARKIGASNVTVLITGETGTGKEVLARIIHGASPRAGKPLIAFNCSAVPREMLDSQMFGYRRGAFTGAITSFPGVIRTAAASTLLLDEIGEVPLDLQPKLLRFLEAQEIQALGEAQPVSVDVRILAATNADLDQLLASGRFREDLFYRLNVIRLHVPPLRERREEIPMLVQHFLDRFTGEAGKQNVRIAEETMEYLLLYRWPGNVRELLNQIRRLVALAESGTVLMPEHLSPAIVASRRTLPAADRDLAPREVLVRLDQPLSAAIEHVERAMVPWALRSAGGRVEVAAKMLGLSRKGLYLKRQRLGLDNGEAPAQLES